MKPMRLAVLGCGLLGGSTAAAWRHSGCVTQVVGFDIQPERARRAQALGIVDQVADTVAQAVAEADCIVLATPVGAMAALLAQAARHARADALITDVGSTKVELLVNARQILGDTFSRFVPAHPIAGGETPGIEQASAELFRGRWLITTPAAGTDALAVGRVEANWAACGARIERMTAQDHDRVFAAVSHLPHLLAFALVNLIAGQPDGARKLQFAGAGFRDFTRIAASDPVMWRDIALANRGALGHMLGEYRRQLELLQAAVDAGDGAALEQIMVRASRVRREQDFDDAGSEPDGR